MVKRIGRYLKKHRRLQYEFEEQNGERGPELTVGQRLGRIPHSPQEPRRRHDPHLR
jgi:hypothetical protein